MKRREIKKANNLNVFRQVLLLGLLWGIGGLAVTGAPAFPSWDAYYRGEPKRLVEAGELLLSELHCVNCHEPEGDVADRIPVIEAPRLSNVSDRVKREYLAQWLGTTSEAHGSDRMPDLLGNQSSGHRQEVAKNLVAFVGELSGGDQAAQVDSWNLKASNPVQGKKIYESIGCVACHGTAVSDDWEKFRPAGLIQFLLDPLACRPSGRMPNFKLTLQEAADISKYVLGGKWELDVSIDEGVSQPAQVALGKKSFQALGCAACHMVSHAGLPVDSKRLVPSLNSIAGKRGGCLAKAPLNDLPRYALDHFQRRALVAALADLRDQPPLSENLRAHRLMIRLNCYACHERGGFGRYQSGGDAFFVGSGLDLGDEGRLPPTLSGVGQKMTPQALESTITGQLTARPYMTTRMPRFHESHAELLADWFAIADIDPEERPTARTSQENQVGRNMWGRALLGTKGLSCITCHSLGGKKSLGIQAMDLDLVPSRLRPEWFRDYLIDPAKFRPGTRMPSFWPGGKPSLKGHGGSTDRQIDSLWAYLNELDQSQLPEGMENREALVLKPKDRAIVFRTFMEGVGNHAIAVGYPQGVNAAFDSLQPRWAIAWEGAFLNAESTWEDRFTPLAKPEGKNLVAIQALPPVATEPATFLGYRLAVDTGVPTFRYRLEGVEISDMLKPSANNSSRLIRWLGKSDEPVSVWIEIASGIKFVPVAGGWLGEGKLLVSTKANTRIFTTDDGMHLQAQLSEIKISINYTWPHE